MHVKSELSENAVSRVVTLRGTGSSSFDVIFTGGDVSKVERGQASKSADGFMISPNVTEWAFFDGICKMRKISQVTLQAALKDESKARKFTFSRTQTAPRAMLQLDTGPFALLNVECLIFISNIAAEDLLLGIPVLRHLDVDSKTLLENSCDPLDESDCLSILKTEGKSEGGRVSRVMIARLNCVPSDGGESTDSDCPNGDSSETVQVTPEKANEYHSACVEEDSLPMCPPLIFLNTVKRRMSRRVLPERLKKPTKRTI